MPSAGGNTSENGFPRGPSTERRSPAAASYRRAVPGPIRLHNTEMPEGDPAASRRTSKTENGRRSSGSVPAAVRIITNCPGWLAAAMAGASR